MHGWNVEMTVHVEAERADGAQLQETVWLSEMHERFRLPNAIVGHVWLAGIPVWKNYSTSTCGVRCFAA